MAYVRCIYNPYKAHIRHQSFSLFPPLELQLHHRPDSRAPGPDSRAWPGFRVGLSLVFRGGLSLVSVWIAESHRSCECALQTWVEGRPCASFLAFAVADGLLSSVLVSSAVSDWTFSGFGLDLHGFGVSGAGFRIGPSEFRIGRPEVSENALPVSDWTFILQG